MHAWYCGKPGNEGSLPCLMHKLRTMPTGPERAAFRALFEAVYHVFPCPVRARLRQPHAPSALSSRRALNPDPGCHGVVMLARLCQNVFSLPARPQMCTSICM